MKYIFVTGGVSSSLGKGISAAAIGSILESRGVAVTLMKLDPYLNVDPGTMNPFEHGEIYVTDDGAETDLDLGHYYRFTNSMLSKFSSTTSGKVYETVIQEERKGTFLGKTVQIIPHVTDEIKRKIVACAEQDKNAQAIIVEVGGTVGDIESLPFLEAIRQFKNERLGQCINIHLTYVPFLKAAGEVKTKPTQHAVQAIRAIGIYPDIILCRCETPLEENIKEKISLFCNVPVKAVIDAPDVSCSIYELPLQLQRQKIDEIILSLLHIKNATPADLTKWKSIVHNISYARDEYCIGIVGKYLDHQDAYKSIFEALHHAAIHHNVKLRIEKFESDKLSHEQENEDVFSLCNGLLVPGGFGERGWSGKLFAAQHCRKNLLPYFGICLGMQIMAIEFARNVLQLSQAHSTEVNMQAPDPIISLLEEQKHITNLGGSMRLGKYLCTIKRNTKAFSAYQNIEVGERHRHRYEFNNKYKAAFEQKGMIASGIWDEGHLVEIIELEDHPWMLGVQFHPEFLSKPFSPHPLFVSFLQACITNSKAKSQSKTYG